MEGRRLEEGDMSRYAAFLRGEERAPATVEKYVHDAREFLCWLGGRLVTREVAADWRESLVGGGLSPATVNTKISAVNGLLRLLGWEDCRARFLKVQRRVFREPGKELSRGEYDRLRKAAGRLGRGQLRLLMETICATGIRVSEVRCITAEAVAKGRAEIRLKGKVRTVLLAGKLREKLLQYARKEKIASGEIFLTKDGSGMSRGQIWRGMKALCKAAGVRPEKVFPHNLRHLFAVTFYRASGDIVKLADLLGHSSINTTRIYLMTTGQEHARQLERLGLVS